MTKKHLSPSTECPAVVGIIFAPDLPLADPHPMRVTVYTKPGCHLCDEALLMLDNLSPHYAIDLTEVNIIENIDLYEQYKYLIPVVEVTDVQVGRLSAPITEPELNSYLEKAHRAMNPAPSNRIPRWLGRR